MMTKISIALLGPLTLGQLGLFHACFSFVHQAKFIGKINFIQDDSGCDSIQRPFSMCFNSPGCKEKLGEYDRHLRHHESYRSTLLTDCHFEQQHQFCDDVDKVLEGLVSPAPESFCVMNSVISRINSERERLDECLTGCGTVSALDDLEALSSFLVKTDYAVDIYLDSGGVFKWRLAPRAISKFGVIYPMELIREGKRELYHEQNTLQLSRMALDLATENHGDPQILPKVHVIAVQAEKRLALALGSDLRGPTSSDACLNFALAGVQRSCALFRTLCCVGIHELERAGLRASFQPKVILRMVEKFAASGIHFQQTLDLYRTAAVCLEKKGYSDAKLIESLKDGSFGFHCDRPLLWLWRYSSRQKKVSVTELTKMSTPVKKRIKWDEIFYNPSNPLVVDLGSGMGTSLLNLSTLKMSGDGTKENSNLNEDLSQLAWSEMNYAGADVNKAMVNFGNGVVSRDTAGQRKGRVHFFCVPAEEFLAELRSYPGRLALTMVNFPSPYRLGVSGTGNSQLPPLRQSDQFIVTRKVLVSIAELMSQSSALDRGRGLFLFQTKCEDVAVHVKNECLSSGAMECVPCIYPVEDINFHYKMMGKRPKRVEDWLKATPSAERAEGSMYSSAPLLPMLGRPETEVQCSCDHTVVHRCLFQIKRGEDDIR